MWANSRWKGSLFADDLSNNEFLAGYSQYLNSVEGNTSFYADPSESQLARWATQLPEHFRFVFKVPRRFSHQLAELDHSALLAWWRHFTPVHPYIGLIHLQLPATAGPAMLGSLTAVLELLSNTVPLAVEVRHPAFFDKAEHELTLNRLLQQYGAERVVLDSRALFSVAANSTALLDAQAKKPRLPVHAICLSDRPMLRFIGTDDAGVESGGMASRVKENRLHEYISLEHYGIIVNGEIDTTSDEVKKWTPAFENYTFKEADAGTELIIDMDINAEHKVEFEEMWPKALAVLKELAEQ